MISEPLQVPGVPRSLKKELGEAHRNSEGRFPKRVEKLKILREEKLCDYIAW